MRESSARRVFACAGLLTSVVACWDFRYDGRDEGLRTSPMPTETDTTSSSTETNDPSADPSGDPSSDPSADPKTGGADAATPVPDASAPASACKVDGLYCGGHGIAGPTNILHRCTAAGTGTVVAKCANGCIPSATDGADACSAPTACVAGGSYCGGDKVNGDPDVLYRCIDGTATSIIRRCFQGCQVNPPGQDDACR